jgi:hypothetical protein
MYVGAPIFTGLQWNFESSTLFFNYPFCSYNAACAFLEKNGLLSIIRAHEAQDAG